ncbi:MAG TPA: NTP transferase domain-containing protein [Acidimicrobiales bacterium]|nr:NTP transferase domain-containing protein [Acidimicrobiales bacterium]
MGVIASERQRVAVVILAAGHGRRLGSAGGPGPKWLVDVGAAPIADRHLTAIEQALGSDTEVIVVVGHAAERVERYCGARALGAALRPLLVENEHHVERNNWYSLLVGLDALEARLGDDDVVVVLNSDLFARPEWLGALLRAAAELGDVPGALAVDVARPLTDEAMKVAAGTRDPDGRRWCTAIGKVGVDDPVGEYVGLSALRRTGRLLVHEALRSFTCDGARADEWYEEAFQQVSAITPFLTLSPTPSSAWVEIDDIDDLRAAERLAVASVTPRSRGSG